MTTLKRSSDSVEEKSIKKKKIKQDIDKKKVKKDVVDKKRKFSKNSSPKKDQQTTKPDWNEFKKQKKELKVKRKQTKSSFEVVVQAKQLSEKLRRKNLTGGKDERDKLVNELHSLLGGQGNYVKFVLSHDMGRVVQYLLKFGNQEIREGIANELIPSTVLMLQSKYGKFCIKRLLKYGTPEIRSKVIKACYGNAVKLTSHAVSAPVFEYAYSNWAQPAEKINLIQEFFGDMYKQTKDENVKHLRDVYKNNPEMKKAALESTKSNLSRVLNKTLLDSGLIQSVIYQYIQECPAEDKADLLTQLSSHVVVLSNSKDGVRIVMNLIWNGTNKDKKTAMKTIKEHVIELCQHEHGHLAVITLLDAVDDTVLLNKLILNDILSKPLDLAKDEWGRKVLLWTVNPGNTTHFHPNFVSELKAGRDASMCKKDPEIRRKEILNYCVEPLLKSISDNVHVWLENGSIALVTFTILKHATNKRDAYTSIAKVVVDPNWKIKNNDDLVLGVEHPGLHMVLKKLLTSDKNVTENTFSEALYEHLNNDIINVWIKLNRGCFVLVALLENGPETIKEKLLKKLKSYVKLLSEQSHAGSKILLQKLE